MPAPSSTKLIAGTISKYKYNTTLRQGFKPALCFAVYILAFQLCPIGEGGKLPWPGEAAPTPLCCNSTEPSQSPFFGVGRATLQFAYVPRIAMFQIIEERLEQSLAQIVRVDPKPPLIFFVFS
jgi:hypothetical protein